MTAPGRPEGSASEALGPIDAVFDHCAVAAPRLRDLLALYHDVLGGEICNGGDNIRVGYRAMQLKFRDGSRIELMEPLAGSTFFDSFFARGGGLHHVTFKVKDIHEAVDALQGAGYTLTGLYVEDPTWREAFLHPRSAHSVLVQVAQPGPTFSIDVPGITIEAVLNGDMALTGAGNGIPSP